MSDREPTGSAYGGTTQDLGDGVLRTVLPGGLRVITEHVDGVRSAAFGVWVDVGSRDEDPAMGGVSHFLEHLLFKGTPRRTALDIASVVDSVGGEMNAWTGHEQTCYYARVLDTDLPLAVDVVTDMVTASLIRSEDVDGERTVVLEEIAMRDDEPADAVQELFSAAMFGDAPLGRPITGTVTTMTAMARDDVHAYWQARYVEPVSVVTAAGSVDHGAVVDMVSDAYARGLRSGPAAGTAVGHAAGVAPRPLRSDEPGPSAATWPGSTGSVSVDVRDTEQANVVLGTLGLARRDPRRYALSVLSTLLGGGMSSRLFQEVREKRGLAYSVHTFVDSYADVGVFGVYAGCAPERVEEVLRVCRDQVADVASGGLTDEEVARAKGQLSGSMVLGLEDTGSRMSRLGKGELAYGEIPPVGEVLRRVTDVAPDDVRALAAELFARPRTLAVLGPDRVGRLSLDGFVAP